MTSEEYAALIATTVAEVARRLDDVRLPLHILLENRFGDLNENQEEMLATARAAAEDADAALRRLQEIAVLDRGTIELRHDRVRLSDLVSSLLPILQARGERRGVHVTADIAPALPLLTADRARLQEALSLLLGGVVRATPDDGTVRITVATRAGALRLDVMHPGQLPNGPDVILVRRLIAVHGGSVDVRDGAVRVELPV